MKYKNSFLYCLLSAALLLTSCSHDNYPMPDAGIKGAIVDNTTGDSVQTEEPNGIKIRLLEEAYGSSVSPIDFWAKPDGTFENANVFSGKYQVVPVEGAFFPADTTEVDITGEVEVTFKVTPYLTIDATATAGSKQGSVVVAYKISREKVADKIINCKALASAYPQVSNTINEYNISHDLSAQTDDAILQTNFSDTITGLNPGDTYYFRAAASTNNAYNKYNYSKIIELKIP